MKLITRRLLPLAILAGGGAGVWLLMATAPEIEELAHEPSAPLVAVAVVEPQSLQLSVSSQGTVSARTESQLTSEVAGKIIAVAPSFVSGGYFQAGELLLEIEAVDYEVGRERARANLARAESEHARARKEHERMRGLARGGIASQAQLDDAERTNRVADAVLREARALLAQAERDLERTKIRAPFTGRVRDERVDLGQFVTRGAAIATLYATDRAEVRLPIADEELAFLDLPLWHQGAASSGGPRVVLRASFAGGQHSWEARIVRTEGEIDPRSRMVHAVAQVEDPYRTEGGRPPLAVGLFVEAEIFGRHIHNVIVTPRGAMRDDNHLLVVDAENRLRLRLAEVVRKRGAEVVLDAATLKPGDRVVVTGLEVVVDGMLVRPVLDGDGREPASAGGPTPRTEGPAQ